MKKLGFLILPLMLLLSACATQPAKNETLQQAQQAVSEAETNPAVARYAPVALRDAQQTLQQAQQAARAGAEGRDVEHLAYLAMRRAEIAQSLARRELLVRSAEDVQQQRAQVMLEARERAAQQAQQEAQLARQETQQAQQALQEAQRQLSEFEPKQTERGLVLTLGEVLFPFDSANLQAGNQRAMDRLAQYLQANPDQEILIEGHTDSVGTAGYNQRLSEQRAESVYQALEQRGVDPSRVRVVGLGENYPVADNSTNAGRSENRRVEVVIAQDQMPPSRQEVQQAQRQRSNPTGDQQQQQQQPRG